MKSEKERSLRKIGKHFTFPIFVLLLAIVGFVSLVNAADPVGPDSISSTANETKTANNGTIFNISGGYISTFNISATIQNPRWKGFVGNVTGSFTLDDSSGSTIYDWSLSSITGRIYATRNSSSITWSSINCSNLTYLEAENVNLNHNNTNDNISVTFNTSSGATHNAFYVGSVYISANSCPTLNTYKNDASQDTDFEEIALYTSPNTVYASILEQNVAGFDNNLYDFQMIVPENGSSSWTGATAYYIYVELGT